jgi:hypothetical protein
VGDHADDIITPGHDVAGVRARDDPEPEVPGGLTGLRVGGVEGGCDFPAAAHVFNIHTPLGHVNTFREEICSKCLPYLCADLRPGRHSSAMQTTPDQA